MKNPDTRTLEQRQADWVHHLPDKFIGCRGDHHDWPTLKPGRLPRGVRILPGERGCSVIAISCRNCGRTRYKITLPGGYYDRDATYIYRDPDGYAAPKGLRLTKGDYTAELYRRIAESDQTGDKLALEDLAPEPGDGISDPATGADQVPVPPIPGTLPRRA